MLFLQIIFVYLCYLLFTIKIKIIISFKKQHFSCSYPALPTPHVKTHTPSADYTASTRYVIRASPSFSQKKNITPVKPPLAVTTRRATPVWRGHPTIHKQPRCRRHSDNEEHGGGDEERERPDAIKCDPREERHPKEEVSD